MSLTELRKTFDRRGVKVGSGIMEFTTPGIGHTLKQGGCDFAFIDMEHSGIGIESVKQLLRYVEAADLPAFVRPPSDDYHDIAGVLDVGAEGILVPMVADAEQARHVVSCMKYPPVGRRGVSMSHGSTRWQSVDQRRGQLAANRRTVSIMLIETVDGVENVDAIARVKGVDVLWVGHSDLSASLGIPGDFDNPKFKDALNQVAAAAKRHKKHLGRLTRNVEEAQRMTKLGFDVICYGSDDGLLRSALTSGIESIRKGARGRRRT